MRITRTLVALALAAGAVGGAAALWLLGSALSAPAARAVGAAPGSLHAEPVSFPSESGSTIRGWLIRGVPGRGAVVLAHPVRANRLAMVERAEFIARSGYSVLLFDAQAHGESPGEHITFGHLESLDARAAVAFVRRELPSDPVGYLGVSQGGAAALLGPAPLTVQALILEAVYPSLREAVRARIAIRLGPLAEWLAPLLLLQVRPRLGVDPDRVAPIEGIRQIRAPLLLLAGERDRHTLLAESRRLFEAAPEPKSLWVVRGAAHVDFHRFDRAEYERRVLDFLARTIARGAS
jgi:fermentation-respiration switch protein FrsA (DUF1100 family)